MSSSPNNKHLLKKPSASIYIENDKIKQLGRKAFNFLLKKAQPNMLNNTTHRVDLKEFRSIVNTKSNTKFLKKTLEELASTSVTWNYTRRDNKNVWGTAALIADAEIIDNKTIEYSFSNKMSRLLHHPNIYALIDLRVQGRITSKYTLALYEIAVDQCRMKDRCGETQWYKLEEVYVILGVAKDSKYRERYNNFKSQILDKATKELSEKTEYTVKYKAEARNSGKSITHIKFIITFDGEYNLPDQQQAAIPPQTTLKQINIPEELLSIVPPERHQEVTQIAKEILRNYESSGHEVLKFYFEYAKAYRDRQGPAKNWGAVIRMALSRNEYEMAQEKLIREKQIANESKKETLSQDNKWNEDQARKTNCAGLIASLTEKENEAFEIYIRLNDPMFKQNPNRKIVDGTKMRNIENFIEHLKLNPVYKPLEESEIQDIFAASKEKMVRASTLVGQTKEDAKKNTEELFDQLSETLQNTKTAAAAKLLLRIFGEENTQSVLDSIEDVVRNNTATERSTPERIAELRQNNQQNKGWV